MIKILLASTLFFGCFTGAWAASPDEEVEFVNEAPKLITIFQVVDDRKGAEAIRWEIQKLKEHQRSLRTDAKIKFFSLLLEFPGSSATFEKKHQIIEAYGELVLQPELVGYGLTKAEAAAIYSYTTEDYQSLNSELRKPSPSKSAIAYTKMLNAALNKLPPFVGLVKRGVSLPGSVLQSFYVGNTVEFKSFTSATSRLELSDFEVGYRFLIHSKQGRDVSMFSHSVWEAEVLFKAGTKFRVIAARTNVTLGGKIAALEYELEEIE